MSVLISIAKVLGDAGEPLHYKEITKRLLQQGLWSTTGQTPEATVNAQLAVDIKRRGEASLFQRADKGVFALRAWESADSQIKSVKTMSRPEKQLSFTDAAELVLDKHASKSPMHYRVITDKALELGLIATAGKTPEATLYAQIITEIQRRTKRGERPRFVRYGKGYVGLSKWMGLGLAFQIDQHNQNVRRKLVQQISKMPPAEFEALIGTLLAKLGFEDVIVTSFKNDGGIDVRGTMVTGDVIRTRMAVQVKRWKANVQAPTIQQVRGSLGAHEQGLIITTSDFSKGARAEAERVDTIPVALMNGEQLVKLLVENDIGIRRTSYDLIEPGWEENI
jgi:restriction system protein